MDEPTDEQTDGRTDGHGRALFRDVFLVHGLVAVDACAFLIHGQHSGLASDLLVKIHFNPKITYTV